MGNRLDLLGKQNKKLENTCIVLFQLCIVLNSLFDLIVQLNVISKFFMMIFWVFMVLYMSQKSQGFVKVGYGFLLVTVFTGYCFISCFWAVNKPTALAQMWTQTQMYLLFFFAYTLIRETGRIEAYFMALYLSGFFLILFALLVYGGREYFLLMLSGKRMGGLFTNENTFGMALAKAFLVGYYLFLKNKRLRYLLSMIPLAFFALSSGSKKALLIMALGILLLSLLYYGLRRLWKVLLILALCTGIGIYLSKLPIFASITKRVSTFLSEDYNTSDENRMAHIITGLALFWKRPLLGYGLQNYRILSGTETYSHNNLIELMVSGGVVGLVSYYVTYIYSVTVIFRKRVSGEKLLTCMLLILFGITFVCDFAAVSYYSKTCWFFWAALLGEIDRRYAGEAVKEKVI